MSKIEQGFNDKDLCEYGEKFQEGMRKSFICKKTNHPCSFCRLCRTVHDFKMLYTSLQCPLKNN